MTTEAKSDPAQESEAHTASANLDRDEVAHFNRLAAEWWDRDGEFKPLHALAPARLAFIRSVVDDAFQADFEAIKPLKGRTVLDVGCGGGLASEPLARLGGRVTGIDPGTETIEIAKAHARQTGLDIDYRATTAEALVEAGQRYDLVVCLEVLEHVPDPAAFVATLSNLIAPNGCLILSTLNRTAKSYALAIVGAEYVLRWLEPGTHTWDKFITPDELRAHLRDAGLEAFSEAGVTLNPISGFWDVSSDLDVNYMMAARPIETIAITQS